MKIYAHVEKKHAPNVLLDLSAGFELETAIGNLLYSLEQTRALRIQLELPPTPTLEVPTL